MNAQTFRDQRALLEYIEQHDLAYAWEGMSSFSHRLRTLAPGQYEIVEVRLGAALLALCSSRKISCARRGRPMHRCAEAVANKRERLRARREAKKKRFVVIFH
jgi:hypothetical protein